MSQGVVLRQPVLFASPLGDPRAFLGTLPSPASPSKGQIKRTMASGNDQQELVIFSSNFSCFFFYSIAFYYQLIDEVQEKGLRIAWQYKKYLGGQQSSPIHDRG